MRVSDKLSELDAIQNRHPIIDKHKVDWRALDNFQRFCRVLDHVDLVKAKSADHCGENPQHVDIIFHDQHRQIIRPHIAAPDTNSLARCTR